MTTHPCRARVRHAVTRVVLAIASGLLLGAIEAPAQQRVHQTRTHRATTQSARTTVCDTAWTNPQVLRTATGRPVYVEAPVTVTNATGTFLIGAPTFRWQEPSEFITRDSKPVVATIGVKLQNDSSAVLLPPVASAKKPYMPIAIARGEKLLAIWGTSGDTALTGVFHQDTLWEATLAAGRWSTPRPIWASGTFEWHPGAASYVADDSSVIVAFPARDDTRAVENAATILSRSRDRWTARTLHLGSLGPRGVALMRATPSDLLIAAVGSLDTAGVRALHGIYVVRVSTRDSASAPRVQLIRELARTHAEDPQVLRTADGLHFVWRQPGQKILADDSLVEATSRDDGATWTVTSALSLGGDTRGLSASPLGGSDAIAMTTDIRRQAIVTLLRRRGRWTRTHEDFPDAKTIPMISIARDRITAAFGQTRSSIGPEKSYDAPVLVTTSRALRCETSSAPSSRKRLRAPPGGKSTPR